MGNLRSQFRWFQWTFWVSLLLMAVFAVLAMYSDPIAAVADHPLADYVFWSGCLVFLAFLIVLARLARTVERSPLLWVIGAILCSPVGAIIVYVRMTLIAKEQMRY